MNPYFNNAERVARLERAALGWVGTPFMDNSNSRGPRGGVSCQKLVAEIYRECGACDFDAPDAPIGWGKFCHDETRSILVPFMEAVTSAPAPAFMQVQSNDLVAGDMLGFRIGKIVHHCGVLVRSGMADGLGEFIHVISKGGVMISNLSDAIWWSRLAIAWRPVER